MSFWSDIFRWFLSRDRDHLDQYLAGNHPGEPWYRLPTVGLVTQLDKGGNEEERSVYPVKDSFLDVDGNTMSMSISGIIKVSQNTYKHTSTFDCLS
jgi:hypothetical protein